MTPKRKADIILNNIDKTLERTKGQDTISIDRQDLLDLMIMYSTLDYHIIKILTVDSPITLINDMKMKIVTSKKDIFGLPI